jgi:sulfate/thiosulfate transport system ATP-binding protein
VHDTFPVTSVFVTHDQEEAMEVAHEIVIMNRGRIEQSGVPLLRSTIAQRILLL